MLVITGMGRSGTSVLAALCQRLGFDPGGAHVEGTVGLMTSLGIPFRCLRFPEFLAQPEQVFDGLRFGGLSFRDGRAREQWRRLIDYSKVRHSPRWQEAAAAPAPGG